MLVQLVPSRVAANQVPDVVRTESSASECPTFDLSAVFFEDYYPNTVWTSAGRLRTIRWTMQASEVYDEPVARLFTDIEMVQVRTAFALWDEAVDSIVFQEVGAGGTPEIVVGWTAHANVRVSADGYWNAWWDGAGTRARGTIRMRVGSEFLQRPVHLRHGVLHEIGNVLGLGDIVPTTEFESVMEDPWQPPYGPPTLSATDRALARQIYGESTCGSSTPAVATTYRLRCVKGQKIKVIRGIDPACPKGFRQRGKKIVVP